ncbi:HAD family hydrolase [Clostridium sp. YIM B02555]|uniref:HAD family hydrolase n=1 Tax=Clostridium sp. YIM B02555 TaxID=2911968 RepID=UPI001EEDDEF5|nr:HAD family hydrolase [Clostridium sp. YIM B02555]
MNKLWLKDINLSHLQNNIHKYQIISFDIFDTLISRTVNKPSDIFELVYEEFKNKIYKECPLRKEEFKKLRILAEKKARENKKMDVDSNKVDFEVTLLEIYNEFQYLSKYKKELIDLELNIEKKNIFINPVVYEFLKDAKEKSKKIILVSDMYLTRKNIEDILFDLGIDLTLIDNIFVSSEFRKSKSSGKLYKEVIRYYNVEPKYILHIGDNELADVEGAIKNEIDYCRYNPISKMNLEIELEKIKYGITSSKINNIRKIALNLSYTFNKEERFWFEIGVKVLGPFLTFLSQYTVDVAKNQSVNQIYALMREGVILGKTLRQAVKYNDINIKISELYVSREATNLASLDEFKVEYIKKYFLQRIITVEEMLNSLGLNFLLVENNEINKIRSKQTCKLNEEEMNQVKNAVIKNKEIINKEINRRKSLLLNYLKNNIDLSKKFITLDLGYRGTIQKNLNNVLKNVIKQENIIHILGIGSEEICEKVINNVEIRSYISSLDDFNKLTEAILWDAGIIEELMNDERGSTQGYKLSKNNDIAIPILEENKIPKEEFCYKNICQEGILIFQKLFYESVYKISNDLDYLKYAQEVMVPISRLLEVPTIEEVKRLSNLHHDENTGTNFITTFINEKDIKLAKKYNYQTLMDIAKSEKIMWPQGVATLMYHNENLLQTIKFGKENPKYFSECFNTCNMLLNNGIDKVIVYGAGEIGRTLVQVLQLCKMEIEFIIDRNSSLWGNNINDIQIISLEESKLSIKQSDTIIIASFSFLEEIEKSINKAFDNINIVKMRD